MPVFDNRFAGAMKKNSCIIGPVLQPCRVKMHTRDHPGFIACLVPAVFWKKERIRRRDSKVYRHQG